MLRTLLLSTLLGVVTLYCYHYSPSVHFAATLRYMDKPTWSSPFAAWHARALLTPYPNPRAFIPTRESLLLAVLLNAPAETEGITLAIFSQPETSETIAIDALGRVLQLSEKDSSGILGLARRTLDLPETGNFRNTWVIKHDRTSQPIDRLFVPSGTTSSTPDILGDLKQVSVQGFSKEIRELKSPLDGITELPDVLWELFGLILEAQENKYDSERRDDVVLMRVRGVVEDLF